MMEDMYKGHIEIFSVNEDQSEDATAYNTVIKLDGKIIPRVQSVNLTIDVRNKIPIVTLVMMPKEASITMNNIAYTFKRGEIETPPITSASFYHYECDCGSSFPVEENMVSKGKVRCPACGKTWEVGEL